MFRLTALLTLGFACCAAQAADLPKDITPEKRAEVIKQWQAAYKKQTELWEQKKEDAITLTKFATSEQEGKKKLAEANKALKVLEDRPWFCEGSPFHGLGSKDATVGSVVVITNSDPKGSYALAGEAEGGVLVETVLGSSTQPMIRRYLILSADAIPKNTKGKFSLPPMWYFAGEVEIKNKTIPMLYRFELKPEDFPKK